ncbi:MAG TPA: hypothetical protein VHC48_02370, partial [Puia sp.]|nr:hypothetical protein [Puia sp.]
YSRRDFIRMNTLAASGLLLPGTGVVPDDELQRTAEHLLMKWGRGMLRLQVTDPALKGLHGGILCPACSAIHGRSGDAMFPMLYLYDKTRDEKYLRSALMLYDWMENNVSLPDGSWVNEVSVSDWKGTTVFGVITLAHALMQFGHLLEKDRAALWKARLQRAAQYVYDNFTIATGNINYPISGSYALALTGKYLGQSHFVEKGRQLAGEVISYFTPERRLIYGEGHPDPVKSPHGCYSIDLGYNVEESLPSLVLYARLMDDKALMDILTVSLRSHAAFMLPDGGWDNSWGTRNFKWTWWGSRTSDGCQAAYAFMAEKDPAFYTVALRNTQQLAACTHDDLLHGGPHYHAHGVLPCVHHTLGHSKALALLLSHPDKSWRHPSGTTLARLPRESPTGIQSFPEIRTWLAAYGPWRATFTAYDVEYLMKGGHASGGALTLLYHIRVGTIIAAGMNRYQLVEAFNMQRDKAQHSVCLTPRFELEQEGIVYSTLNDLNASAKQEDDRLFFTKPHLVDESQRPLGDGAECAFTYQFKDDLLIIRAKCSYSGAARLKYILPLICTTREPVKLTSPTAIEIHKPGGIITVQSNKPFIQPAPPQERVFNFVPGFEAFVLEFTETDLEVTIRVR